jgi:hypothetical protein
MKNNIAPDTPGKRWILECFLAAMICVCGTSPYAQPEPTSPVPIEKTAPAAPSVVEPAPIPLPEVATDADAASARLRDILAELSPDPIAEEVAEQLPVLTREIDARLRETRTIVAQRASLEILVGLESEWRRLRRNLAGWTRDLTNRATSLEHQIAELDELERPGNKHSMRPRVRTHRPRYFIASKPLSPRSGRHGKRSKNKEHGY